MEPNIETPKKKSNGALVGSIIIILILIIGGIYLASTKVKEAKDQANINEAQTTLPADNLSASDNLADIQTDLNNNADINALDQGLQ